MIRFLRAIPVIIAAALFLATLALNVRSYWVADGWSLGRSVRVAFLICDRGGIFLERWIFLQEGAPPPPLIPRGQLNVHHDIPKGYLTHFARYRPTPPRPVVGFCFGVDGVPDSVVPRYGIGIAFPLWCPAVLFAILPVRRFVNHRRRRRPKGSCSRCGYDVRASPDRCPECGAPG